jgi:hypothetical protein
MGYIASRREERKWQTAVTAVAAQRPSPRIKPGVPEIVLSMSSLKARAIACDPRTQITNGIQRARTFCM